MDLEAAELTLLYLLEEKVRGMFAFTGWEDDVDDDARASVLKVRAVLGDLTAIRRIQESINSSPSAEGNPK